MNFSAATTGFERYQSLNTAYESLHDSYDAQIEQYKCLLVEHHATSVELQEVALELVTTLTFERRNKRLIQVLESKRKSLGKIFDVFRLATW